MMLASVKPAAAGAVRVPYLAAAFPEYWAGRLPRLYFRGLLKVHPRYGLSGCCNLKAYICPQAFTKEVSLPQCLGATGMYRQFPGRDFHPLVIWALVAHQYVGVDQFSVCPITEEGCFL